MKEGDLHGKMLTKPGTIRNNGRYTLHASMLFSLTASFPSQRQEPLTSATKHDLRWFPNNNIDMPT